MILMSRPTIVKIDLHGYSLNELKKLRNSHDIELARKILTTVIMLSEGYKVKEISDCLAQTHVNIYYYIKRWNTLGLKALEDQRGKTPSNCKITAEMEADLLKTVRNTIPNEFDLMGHTWTAQLLADYLYQNYEVRVCPQAVRDLLHKNNYSFKRAQKKPTKGVKSQQEAFKKNGGTGFYCRKRF